MRPLYCPSCRAGASDLTCSAVAVVDWDGSEWRPTGEFLKRWLNCGACGHSWTTRRTIASLEAAL